MKGTMQIVDVLAVCRSFALPLYIRRVVVFLILPKAVVVVERDPRSWILFLVHQHPVQKEVVVHRVNFASRSFAHEFGKESTTRRIAFVGDIVRTGRMTPGYS